MYEEILTDVRNKKPIIHCITNPISIERCADAILALGGRPIMAEHPMEVAQITKSADSLVLNLGNITDVRMESMVISQRTANEHKIPVVIDLVGVACSDLRRNFASKLLENKITLVKGNYSEIRALYDDDYKSCGVDANTYDTDYTVKITKELSKKYNTIVLASGKIDVISNKDGTFAVKNGTPQLSKITGTGCMLGAICGCILSASPNIYGALTACGVLGVCGEFAKTKAGNGSFAVRLMDELSNNIKEEDFKIEKL